MRKGCLKGTKGFTLLEVLIGVAVLVILLAISIPAIIGADRDLNMTKLDAAAKEVYTAAQNRLTAMKASGELAEFSTELNTSYIDRSLSNFMTPPADYPVGDSGWQNFFYLTSDDSVFREFVMSDMAFQAIEGRYVVELNPESGDIYGVFYGEYDDGTEFVSAYESYAYFSRSEEDRQAVEIGYYSGSDLSASILPNSFRPTITVHNNEELYLEITCEDMLQFSATRQYLTLKLTMTDEHGGVWEKSFNGLSDLTITGSEIRLYVLLDTMRAGESFSDLTGLYPGDDITAVATMEYSYRGKDVTTDPEYTDNTRTFNSLFDSISETSGSETINISKLRHLDNLRSSAFAYTGVAVGQVLQIAPIYFDAADWAADEWCPTTEIQTQSLSRFVPIINENLFGSSTVTGSASFNGGELYDMVIGSGSAETGLLAHSNCDISGFRFIDAQVNGSSYTGTLAGRVYGGSIADCGVYLTSANRSGVLYSEEEMNARIAKYRVSSTSGSTNIGGLIGTATGNTRIEHSFAAIDVYAPITYTGGFIGSFSGSLIDQCYSSGDVTASAHSGGFVGSITGGRITNSYATSNVTANSYAGGFAGDATGGQITGCIAYGATKKSDDTTDLSTSGGFTGSGGATFTTDAYLRQNGYNSEYDKQSKQSGIEAQAYALFEVDPANSPTNSFPYAIALQGTAYPFRMLTGSHYGNWPQQSTIETSLIYYEKYTNSRGAVIFGYYADGFAKSGDGSAISSWNLNTLKSQKELDQSGYWLVEDGYAVLSIYNLVQIKYNLNSASQVTLNVSTSPGTNRFVLMENPASLPLSTIDKNTGAIIGQFTVKYLYIFQLPFQLQETNRDTTYTFYDKLVMAGYAKGNLSDMVFKDYIFYYCPHFAKNAINPDVNQTDPGRPKYSTSPTIYVRSARQLNALGRYSYYWSKVNAPYSSFIFSQEIDINFARYTKSYCGTTFNLTDTSSSNTYRNRPIGKPMAQTFTDPWGNTYSPGNFQNTYNGNCYKIIDYRLYCYAGEDVQFAGLFGEIMRATITNVVMSASNPEAQSGYIISEYNSQTGRSPGIAALVGLSYAEVRTEQCTISNCAVSGYTVIYSIADTMAPDYAAVGGLIGYNMGIVTNCSADSYLVAAQVNNAGSNSVFVSGLIGSITNGAISNCYAGGTLKMNVKSGLVSSSSINGLTCYSYVWAPYSTGTFTVQNSYSFCTINKTDTGFTTGYLVYGGGGALASHGTVSGCYYLTDSIDSTLNVTTLSGSQKCSNKELSHLTLANAGSTTADNTFPWSTKLKGLPFPFPAFVKNAKAEYVHFGDWPALSPQPEYIAYYEMYSNGNVEVYFFDNNNDVNAATDTTDKENKLTITKAGYGILRLTSKSYLFDVTYKDVYDVPMELPIIDTAITNLDDAAGINYTLYALTDEAEKTLTPDLTAIERLVNMTYHFKTSDGQLGDDKDGTPLYINPEFGRALWQTVDQMGRQAALPLEVRTPMQLHAIGNYSSYNYLQFALTHDVNLNDYLPENATSYAGKLSPSSVFDGKSNALSNAELPIFDENLMGTVQNFEISNSHAAVVTSSSGTVSGITVIDSVVTKADGARALLVCTNSGTVKDSTVSDGSLTLTGTATGALAVAVNTGTITNVTVDSCSVEGSTAAGFVYNNNGGTISGSFIIDSSVKSLTGEAAGFAYGNAATIDACAAVRTDVNAKTRAAGFVVSNAIGATIKLSYVGPEMKEYSYSGRIYTDVDIHGASAFGFAADSMGGTSLCFAVAAVTATNGNAAGFAQNISNASKCFANCTVTASGTGAVAAGFTINGTSITNSYSCGSVFGPTSCGFLNNGDASTTNCYTISSLPASASSYGFGPSSLYMGSNCFWVKDTQRSFNTALPASSAGAVKTFYELSTCGFTSSAAANPFTTTNGTSYAYTITGVTHMGNWPANAGTVPNVGYIGIVKVVKSSAGAYTYSYYGYDCANGTTYQSGTTGPRITFSGGNGTTTYYLYTSNNLSPSLNVQGGWTYSTDSKCSVSNSSTQTSDGYSISAITYTATNAYITFYRNATQMFRIRYRTNSGGTLSFS